MKKHSFILALVVVLFTSVCTYSQKNDTDNFSIKLGGYVNWTALYDSRQTVSLREGQFLLYPANQLIDKYGADVNAKANFNFLSVQTRLNAKISGPEILGAKSSGFIEAEFFGTSDGDANGLRLRHAFVGLQWTSTYLLLGQYWHPMFVPEAFPQTISFNTGVPFQPFSRNPQIRLVQSIGKVNLILSMYSQRDFTSNGPAGFASTYLRNSGIPGTDFQFQLKLEKFLFGAGVDYKSLTPLLVSTKNVAANGTINSFAGTAYLKFSIKSFTFSSQGTYGGNMTDLMMLGGYAVTRVDNDSQTETYSNLNAYSVWADMFVGTEFRFGVFGGYSKNLGSNDVIVGKNYSRAETLGEVLRVSPRIEYITGQTRFGLELEFTQATYGAPDSYGVINQGNKIGNTRLLFGVFYNL
jgi:hypothetical protein